MKFNLLEKKELLDFEKEIGVDLVVTETDDNEIIGDMFGVYYVAFENSRISEVGEMPFEIWGTGDTINEALQGYASKISSMRLIINYRYIKCPTLIHTINVDNDVVELEKQKQALKEEVRRNKC